MPSQVRIIAGPRNKAFDHYIEDIIGRGAWEVEHEYFGITDQERADYVRRKMRMAGKHMNPPVAVKAFWRQCAGCPNGGADCRFHVSFTVYDMDKARAYKEQVSNSAGRRNVN